ncbi:hypothetical protein [Streptomyces sp. NRRL F-5135]|uniref:hypothetical protein n=1 Tax=Streptomyces sp. NRRL F-5135 TaxID=1463858 RepID=UPI0004CBCADE|nr:hypothetical protein [Streptomyces sp. NRRL F-5135]
MSAQPPTPWARKTFGDTADTLVQTVPACLARAHDRARNGQQGVHTQTLEAYGHGLYAAQYEELAAGLENVAGATAVRLQGRTVVVIAEHVLYPIRYAKRDVPVTEARLRKAFGLRADLIRRHGPDSIQGTFDLGLEEPPEHEIHRDLERLPADLGLILIAYACNMAHGVMRLEWGTAELRQEDRYLIWHHHEPLAIPGP